MDVRYLLILFFLASCLPEADTGKALSSKSTAKDPTSTPTNVQNSWNYLDTNSQSISINSSNLNTAYIIGTLVEKYLATTTNFSNANYCLVSSFTLGGSTYQLRSRIVPISYYDFKEKRTVRVMRVDFPDTTNSTSQCSGTLRVLNSQGSYANEAATTYTEFHPKLLCPSCTSALTSSKVRIFRKGITLDEVPSTTLNLKALSLKVDPNFNSGSGNNSCTNNSCQTTGFDCCIDNQCVNDGATKPSAYTTYPTQLASADAERIQNPLVYLNYPHLYYVCGQAPSTTGGSTSGGNGGNPSYDEAFALLKKDYSCIEHLKSETPTSPFQLEMLSVNYSEVTDCLTDPSNESKPMFYKSVVKRLYATCGCSETELEGMISQCPAYDYEVVTRDANGVPTQIDCHTPSTTNDPLPTQMTVTVSSKSAPHRFFDNLGIEKALSTSAGEQEGPKFEYTGDEKIAPDQKSFSMNAILGQMAVSLDRALPAKTVNVEKEQVYFLYTTSGYYTPCPTCSKDSWFSNFSAHPASSNGIGLQTRGYTTERDLFANNTSLGNYEDTIFGRACFVPPTMIPFTHASFGTAPAQRKSRLEAQAAMFANGYQRDWFGFNKGALIGSFDGVTWFAIGKGRIVKASSKKLFLAINAPFADLAENSLNVVNIQAYDGFNTAPDVDYDPQFHAQSNKQNLAGSCQANHMCKTDTDCVTKLGWEYACADVKNLKTSWPTFDVDGTEEPGKVVITLDQILQQKKFPSSDTKRCVYRGAGAPCIVNSGSITDLNKRKALTCAPNFFCANVGSGGHFNDKIARYAASLEELPSRRNHYFGKDADVLGRPLHYVTSTETTSLTSSISQSLRENLAHNDMFGSSYTGLCRPGKALPDASNEVSLSNPLTQHQYADSQGRTDFINQISSCNSTLHTNYRYSSCPVIGTDGNFEIFSATTLAANYHERARVQNACGLDSLHPNASLSASADSQASFSPFKFIEAKPLGQTIVQTKTFARDACMRRAGSVCHTDLDCSPNKMHAAEVEGFSLSYFGNLAEKKYHSEYLVCGQSDPKPLSTDPNYNDYDMSQNRCCREVGSDLSTYSRDVALATTSGSYDPDTLGLKMSIATKRNDPARYSRLASVENLGTADRPLLSGFQDRSPAGAIQTSGGVNALTPNQWKTLGEGNSESCCGGGWIRKFSDSSTNWSNRRRVSVDVSNFSCINSRTVLLTHPEDVSSQYGNVNPGPWVDQDYGDYCKDGTNTKGSCAQFSILDSLADTYPVLTPYTATSFSTARPSFVVPYLDTYFNPRSADGDTGTFIDFAIATRRNIVIYLPSYVPTTPFPAITFESSDTTVTPISCNANASAANITSPNDIGGGVCASGCCYSYEPASRILKVGLSGTPAGFSGKRGGIRVAFNSAGFGTIDRTKPGTNSYYLRRLGKLELSGIPQISHEALYCNDRADRVVPGLFKDTVLFDTDFNNNNFSFDSSGKRYTNQYGLAHEPVFSANDFKCCTPLGKSANSQSKCCSGYGTPQAGTNKFTCGLPAGTNLMVYFNRFVSNEGRGDDQPGGGLKDSDFEAQSGEPIISSAVNLKITDLGIAYCSSGKVRQGGAFGFFEPEPQGSDTNLSSRIYNILDSTNDNGVTSIGGRSVTTGFGAFNSGFRWNHHLYCDD